MLYVRCGFFAEAEKMVKDALKVHTATGRLWGVLIQLQHQRARTQRDFDIAQNTFKQALHEIPKSGEV